MSLLVSVFLEDGIVMASDSRTTYKYSSGNKYVDTTYKTVLMDGKYGISHCLNATVNGKTIDYHLQNFMKKYKGKGLTKIPELLKEYFLNLKPDCVIEFLVCGYIKETRYGYRVNTQEKIEKFNTNPNIVYWAGNRTMPSRLFSPNLYFKKGNKYVKHGFDPLREKPFSIPEGIDLAEFIINTSKKAMSYQNCDQNIGGPIDVLIIKPYEAYWYRRK